MAKRTKQIWLSKLTKLYRITKDECWKVEISAVKKPDVRWYEQIMLTGKSGSYISLHSEDPPILCLYLNNRPHLAQKLLAEVPDIRVGQRYHTEVDLYFPPEQLELVCELAGARKKRQISDAQKAVLVAQLQKARDIQQTGQKTMGKTESNGSNLAA
jgi:hypothetical protein